MPANRVESWSEVVATVLADCDPEARIEFMFRLNQWKEISEQRVAEYPAEEDPYPGDRLAAETRLVKIRALDEHLTKRLALLDDMDAAMRAILRGGL